jgi:pyrroline-5-carboxylate reductase
MADELSIGFLGAGRMATALAKGFVDAGLVDPGRLTASDIFAAARDGFAKETGGAVTGSNADVVAQAKTLFLAVKPHQVAEVLGGIFDGLTPDHLIISIAAGVPIERLAEVLPAGSRVIRVMPNTPALVGASASGYALGHSATPEDGELAGRLLGAVGEAFALKESLLDAVTGLSGSGPAYVYQFIEALSDGGVAAGLPRDVATRLASQTVLGAAKMVMDTGLHPAQLKDMVTSPGGTTIDGLHELERAGVRGAVMNAVRRAADKSKELGRG